MIAGHLFVDNYYKLQQQILGLEVSKSLTVHFYTASLTTDWSWWSGSPGCLLSCTAAWPDCRQTEASCEVYCSPDWPASVSHGCCWWCWGWREPWRRTTTAPSRLSTGTAGSGFSSWRNFLFDPGDGAGDQSKQCNVTLWPNIITCKVLQTSVRLWWCGRVTLCLSSTT